MTAHSAPAILPGAAGPRRCHSKHSPSPKEVPLKNVIAIVLLAACTIAHAEPTPAKKALINKVLELQRPAIDMSSRGMIEQPAMMMMQRAAQVIQARVAPDKREALAKDIQGDLRKFVDDSSVLVREKATKLMPTTMGAALDEKFTEAELKQLVTALESPAYRKFQSSGVELMKTLTDKLLPEVRPELDPKFKALEQGISKRLEAAVAPLPGAAASSPKQ